MCEYLNWDSEVMGLGRVKRSGCNKKVANHVVGRCLNKQTYKKLKKVDNSRQLIGGNTEAKNPSLGNKLATIFAMMVETIFKGQCHYFNKNRALHLSITSYLMIV